MSGADFGTVPTHRPLSGWVAWFEPGDTPGAPGLLGPINDGDERADARTAPRFHTHGWTRADAIVLGPTGVPVRALALRASDGSLLVELDDRGAPVEVSAGGAELVARLEERWADAPADPATVNRLAGESMELRYFLLHRLNVETTAPAALFHCLPWNRVEAVAHAASALLDEPGPESESEAGAGIGTGWEPHPALYGELRHWFTPAATSLAGPLSVLEAGLRTVRPGPWFGREASALLTGLLTVDPERLPSSARAALAGLALRIGAVPALHHSARLAAARLTAPEPRAAADDLGLTARLDSTFVLRAADEDEGPACTSLGHGPVEAEVTVTRGGRVTVEMEIDVFAAEAAGTGGGRAVDAAEGPPCQPVLLGQVGEATGAPGGRRYWMLLDDVGPVLHGRIAAPAPAGQFDVDLDGPPVPLLFLDRVFPAELLASLRANERIGLARWHELVDGLPPRHPAHAALSAYEQELPT
ncbi:hypothetical protein AR457_34345 [Streptomyces agglomeratus]|uniref:Uncharacterized protein n=1 Tax=Streptomyces agglomeratus TaxID=285458 RepID=A0A1E5PGX8_9ACTN|nr:hypothetical protein [Streptomyces agglomeratus]OEJ28810.1 hypothetical protein AS594_34605 [Streptomyces agglomeratus]OEJ37103.1 hypothetical protein BGK70_01845 [Streptomyces agglomeratus]OEJ48455.1 hypothetical protein AR457_34345 [Streptomyces agglomeratus]OEJ56959.1 hypothetical protein BGM19_01895 [Streptomyces agglomeratus]